VATTDTTATTFMSTSSTISNSGISTGNFSVTESSTSGTSTGNFPTTEGSNSGEQFEFSDK